MVKVSCILSRRGVQLILAYSWARPAILVAGKGKGEMFLFLLFLHSHSVPLSSLFVFFISATISSISFLPFSWRRHKWPTRVDMSLNPNTFSKQQYSRWAIVIDVCSFVVNKGWSGGAKVLCILHHRGVQLILAYSWARPAILVVGKGRGGMFLFLLFLHFHSCSSFFPVPLFHLLYSLFYLFSPFLWETTQNDPQGLTCR